MICLLFLFIRLLSIIIFPLLTLCYFLLLLYFSILIFNILTYYSILLYIHFFLRLYYILFIFNHFCLRLFSFMNLIITLSFISSFVILTNNAILIPLIPFLCNDMNASDFQRSLIFCVYSIFQLICFYLFFSFILGLLFIGPLTDKFGRRPFLLISLLGSCLGLLFQSFSSSISMFIIWRGVTGLFSGSLIITQSYFFESIFI